ncbi:hypothetical protein ADM99_14600 [Leptolinea tardivitalis]|uniref:Uncharacterized protein n=1 Tax=Leptolinea tardivitalis TaxID=229920 RepID=A0A0P6X854_9CHLR|nr:hypothetical protein ADM99_14600 [Leptolinea tardivitalis]
MPKRHYLVIVGKVTLNNELISIFLYGISAWKIVAGSGHLYPLWVFLALNGLARELPKESKTPALAD